MIPALIDTKNFYLFQRYAKAFKSCIPFLAPVGGSNSTNFTSDIRLTRMTTSRKAMLTKSDGEMNIDEYIFTTHSFKRKIGSCGGFLRIFTEAFNRLF